MSRLVVGASLCCVVLAGCVVEAGDETDVVESADTVVQPPPVSYVPIDFDDAAPISGAAGAVFTFRVHNELADCALGAFGPKPEFASIDVAPYSSGPSTTIDWDACSHYRNGGWFCADSSWADSFIRVELEKSYRGDLSTYCFGISP